MIQVKNSGPDDQVFNFKINPDVAKVEDAAASRRPRVKL